MPGDRPEGADQVVVDDLERVSHITPDHLGRIGDPESNIDYAMKEIQVATSRQWPAV